MFTLTLDTPGTVPGGKPLANQVSEPLPSDSVQQIGITVIGEIEDLGLSDKFAALHKSPEPAVEAVISVVSHDEV